MSDMLSMISAEPAAAVVSDKPTAKAAGKADSGKSFDQLLTKEDPPQEMPELRAEQVELAPEAQLGDPDTVAPEDAETDDPAMIASEPVVVFSVAHAALQASLEVDPAPQALAEQPVLDDAAPLLWRDETAEPLLSEANADDLKVVMAEQDMLAKGLVADLAPAQPLAVGTVMAAQSAGAEHIRQMSDPVLPLQSESGQADPARAADITDDMPLAQAPTLDAKRGALPPQDLAPVPNPQPDEPQAMTSLAPPSNKEAAFFEKLVAPAPLAQVGADERPVASPLVRNILDRMQELEVSEGKTRILLRPQGMGALEIDILRQADGRMHLAIRVENPLVLDALRNESGALSSFMGEKGFDLSNGGPDLSSYRQMTQGEDAASEDEADVTETETALLDGERVNILT